MLSGTVLNVPSYFKCAKLLGGGRGGEGGKEVGRCEFCLRAEHFEIRISRMKQSSQSAVVGLRPVPAGSPAPVPRTAGLVPGSPGPFPGLGRVPGGSPRDRFLGPVPGYIIC
jgi:hypothetical protein